MKAFKYISGTEFIGGVIVVRLKGDQSYETGVDIEKEFTEAVKGHEYDSVLFDMKEVAYSDTVSVAELIVLLEHMKKHHAGSAIGLINIPKHAKAILEITHTEELFREYGSEKEALASLKHG